jgi:hypothetical protein
VAGIGAAAAGTANIASLETGTVEAEAGAGAEIANADERVPGVRAAGTANIALLETGAVAPAPAPAAGIVNVGSPVAGTSAVEAEAAETAAAPEPAPAIRAYADRCRSRLNRLAVARSIRAS